MTRRRLDDRTGDLFGAAGGYVPMAAPREAASGLSFDGKLRRAVSRALKECPQSRAEVAAAMAEVLDRPTFSKAMLDAYSAESRESHCISAVALVALIQVSGAKWLLDLLAGEVGCIVLESEEAVLLEQAAVERQIEELQRRKRELRAIKPVRTRRSWRR